MEESLHTALLSREDGGGVEPTNPKGKWFVKEDFLSPILGTTVLVPFAIAFVGVVGAQTPSLVSSYPVMLSAVVLSQALSSFVLAYASQFVVGTNVDLLTATFLARLLVAIHPLVPEDHLLIHLLVAQGLFTFALGGSLCLIAKFEVIWFLRFLPYPVTSGFVCGMGLLILDGGLELGAGTNLWQVLLTNVYMTPIAVLNFSLVITCGVFFLVLGHLTHNVLRLPAGILAVTAVFHLVTSALKLTPAQLSHYNLVLQGLDPEPWTQEWRGVAEQLLSVDLSVFTTGPAMTNIVSYMLLHVISDPFYVACMEEVDRPSERFEINREIRMLGWTNVFVGLVLGVPVCHGIKVCVLMKSTGAKTRTWVLLLSVALTALYFVSDLRTILRVVPNCAFGGLVFSLGADFLINSIMEAKKKVAPAEYRLVLVTTMITYLNILVGLTLGSVLTMSFFVVEYSGITGIVRHGTLATVRSVSERPATETSSLTVRGQRASVFWCSGYIFFGTAANVVTEIEEYMEANPQTQLVMIDFELVPAVDASGIHAMTEFARRCSLAAPPVELCFCGMVRRLKMAMSNALAIKGLSDAVRMDFHHVELALMWAEQRLLQLPEESARQRSYSLEAPKVDELAGEEPLSVELLQLMGVLHSLAPEAPSEEVSAAVSCLQGSCLTKTHRRGADLFEEGADAAELFFLAEGSVAVTRRIQKTAHHRMRRYHLNEEKGDRFTFEDREAVKIQEAHRGSFLGCMEFGSSVVSENDTKYLAGAQVLSDQCKVLHIPFSSLRCVAQTHYKLGWSLHKTVGCIASKQMAVLMQTSVVKPFRFLPPPPAIQGGPLEVSVDKPLQTT